MSHTARFLLKEGEPAACGKAFAHVTACFMGDAPDQASICSLVVPKGPHRVALTDIVNVGPNGDLLAYKASLAPAPSLKLFANQLWDTHGCLEPWQLEQSMDKAFFKFGNIGPGCRQEYHVTVGKETSELRAQMQAFVGTTVQMSSFDVKQVGPHDPWLTVPF